jgi:MoaA/NifB/PqqE/SkfB family radical SAM enzyme
MLNNEDCLFNFEVTSYCNAGCPSCFRTIFPTEQKRELVIKHLKVEDFKFLISHNTNFIYFHLKNQYIKLVAKFCGEIGDPLMNPDLSELASIAEDVFDSVEIYTNGGLRNPNWVKNFLEKHKKTHFVFGIDGLTDEINQIYRVNVRTDIALKNMIESAKYAYTRWDYTIFNHNYHELSDVIKFAKKHDLDLLCRFNGREFNKLDDVKINNCEGLLNAHNIENFRCK